MAGPMSRFFRAESVIIISEALGVGVTSLLFLTETALFRRAGYCADR